MCLFHIILYCINGKKRLSLQLGGGSFFNLRIFCLCVLCVCLFVAVVVLLLLIVLQLEIVNNIHMQTFHIAIILTNFNIKEINQL